MDWVEAHNARVVGGIGNERAAAFARELGLPGVAVSDAHSTLEVGVAYTVVDGDPSTPEGLLAALATVELVRGRATYFVRTLTPSQSSSTGPAATGGCPRARRQRGCRT